MDKDDGSTESRVHVLNESEAIDLNSSGTKTEEETLKDDICSTMPEIH